jgi:hypothetical protein
MRMVSGALAPHCPAVAAAPTPPRASSAAVELTGLIQNVPCTATHRVLYDARDNLGEPLAVLDPIPDPRGGYLGVYHCQLDLSARKFRVALGRSTDLMHWSRLAVLDPNNGSMPTLRSIPGAPGFMLAYERGSSHDAGDTIRLQYFASRAHLVADRVDAQYDLPRELSPFNNGTPAFLSITWHGSLRKSVVWLSFHYESAIGAAGGPDREALGLLTGFRHWVAYRDTVIDRMLERQGFMGSHGDRRQFDFHGQYWRVYEAQTQRSDDFTTWHVLLYDNLKGQMLPLTIRTAAGTFQTSFGNPIVQIEPAPGGHGNVLVVTMFQFSGGRKLAGPGELVYYQPL